MFIVDCLMALNIRKPYSRLKNYDILLKTYCTDHSIIKMEQETHKKYILQTLADILKVKVAEWWAEPS